VIIFIFLVSGALAIMAIRSLSRFVKIYLEKEKGTTANLEWFSVVLLLLAAALVIFSFLAPVLLTSRAITSELDFKATGQIGDTIGGLMNPFIALAGVIVTGLAFYMQYKANQLQRQLFQEGLTASNEQFQRQLNHQQFESQFYEMLRLHKENVNEMELSGKLRIEDNWIPLSITKRKVFQEMKEEFESLLELATRDKNNSLQAIEDPNFKYRYFPLSGETYRECYEIFFWGLNPTQKYKLAKAVIDDFKNIQGYQHQDSDNYDASEANNIKFNIDAYRGHSWLLGHYYRHLYQMVTFVVESKIVAEHEEKMRYLKIIRAQLSNYEQIMLFYNWLSGYGAPWEDDKRTYFTKYRMIHNLWHEILFDSDYISGKVEYLRNKFRENEKGELFEIDGK